MTSTSDNPESSHFTSIYPEQLSSMEVHPQNLTQRIIENEPETVIKIRPVEISDMDRISLFKLWEDVPEGLGDEFVRQYGRIFDLLTVTVQKNIMFALFRRWDPVYKVFSFADFDLTPTLEEYATLLELRINPQTKIYSKSKSEHVWGRLAQILETSYEDVKNNFKRDKLYPGWTMHFIMMHLRKVRDEKKWQAFMNITALLIYGLVLFPSMPQRMDERSIGIFGEYYAQGVTIIPVVLAETILGLNQCRTVERSLFHGCWPLLFVWFISHLCQSDFRDLPAQNDNAQLRVIAKIDQLKIPTLNDNEWKQKLPELSSNELYLKVKWLQKKRFILRCGELLSVPLIGIRGCITYNPVMVMRQFGYRQFIPNSFALCGEQHYQSEDSSYIAVVQRFFEAWRRVVLVDDYDPKIVEDKEVVGYRQWFNDRIRDRPILIIPYSSFPRITNVEAKTMRNWVCENNHQEKELVRSRSVFGEKERFKAEAMNKALEVERLQQQMQEILEHKFAAEAKYFECHQRVSQLEKEREEWLIEKQTMTEQCKSRVNKVKENCQRRIRESQKAKKNQIHQVQEEQIEQLSSRELYQENQRLSDFNDQLLAKLLKANEENTSLQVKICEQVNKIQLEEGLRREAEQRLTTRASLDQY